MDVRFIELMPIGHGKEMKPVSNPEVVEQLRSHYGADRVTPDFHTHGNGRPAITTSTAFRAALALSAPFMENSVRIVTASA